MARLNANLAAIEVVQALRAESRAATPAEQEILAGWSGWGAVSAVFEEEPGEDRAFTQGRQQLRMLLTDKEYAAARRDTINAHYTGTALAQAMWDGLAAFGFTGGRVLEPGCGSGNFIGLAPLGTAMAGIELDPVTAHVAAALYPHAQVRNESFADTQLPEGSFDAAIGNVPFGKIHLNDSRYNPGRRHPIHTHFVLKAAALVRPGGWIALITSRYTLDGTGQDAVAARRQLAGLGELAAAVRLPAVAHRRTAGTDVITDVLVIRRFEDGEQPPAGEPAWIQTVPVDVDGVQIPVNQYFADHPGLVLGDLASGGARRPLLVIAPAGADVAGGLAMSLARAAAGRAAPAPRPAAAAAGMGRPPEGFQHARPDGTFTRITDGIAEPFDPPGGRAGQAELRALLGMRDAAMALLDAELATTEDSGLVDGLRADLNARYDAYVAAYGPVNRHTRQVKIRNTLEGRALRGQLLAEGDAQFTGGKLEISDLAVRDQLVADGHAAVTGTGELRFGRTRAARAERQRLLDSGQARALGGTLTLTETGRARVLENAADLQDAVTIIRVRPSQGGFRNDPFAVRVPALEKYDPETAIARKNDIMRHRVLLPRPDVEHAENPEEALAICMDRHARVRLDLIAALLGTASEQDARDRLGTLVYHDPAEGRLVAAQEYLSGDVRVKLRQAAAAAADDPGYQGNVEALTEVIPPDLGPAEIEARLGAVFITPAQVQQFLREILADEAVTVTLAANGAWSVSGGDRHSVAATLTWGTKDRNAQALAEHLLNRKGPVEVTRKNSDGTTWTDEEATQAAREKQAELSDRFAGWAWEDLDRAGEICRRYNDAFNSIVLRSYDEVRLSLPGVNRDISLFWWQKAAIARMIYEPTAGLFHDMGAGKTLEQIIGVMEQKRLGLIRKPVICVKNHLLDQFRDEFLWAFPQARILCADTDDLAGEGRRQFIARCAAENPDAIIMTRGAFESIPLTPEGHEAYLDYMKEMFAVHAADVTESVKDEETLLAEFEERLRAYFDPDYQKDEDEDQDEPGRKRRKVEQDPAMCWEQMGIDYVCVDESQDFNNLWVPSDEPGMAVAFVHRSIDLEMKLHAIRRRYGSRAGALATGTPVTNKISQFYVLQRYLRPERLQAAGFAGYAPWAATYTEPEQRLEMKADGRFGLVTRMRLINFPELLLDLHYFGDFKDADDIGLPRPAIRGGKPEIRGNPAVTELVDYQSTLPDRYNQAKGGRKEKGDDTVVAVIGDGFRAAQDLRLVKAKHGVKPRLTDEPQKIDYIADDVYAEWLAHRDDVYPGDDGQPDPVTGSLQLVFCNEGVPRNDWNLYDELRNLLIERGMPRSAIRFIHNAGDARKKAALFAACNAGHVGVLIGSTEKMGVGTNVQRRCIGIHHVHPHWRPDYDAQEDARARRPGNLNTEVFIKKWITEGSFDTIRAQACERKSVFLRVIKHRDTSVRSIEAPGDDTVSYAEIAAVGAGEPRLIQKAQLESELQQLARAQRRHLNNQNALKVAEQQARASVTAAEQTIRDVDTAAGRVVPTAGDAFSMTVDGTTFTARREAGDHLITCLREARARVPAGECHTRTVGTIGGFQVTADLAHDGREDTIVVRLADLPGGAVKLNHRKLPAGIGLVNRLENRLTGLDKLRLEQEAILDRQRQEITRAQSAIGTPFPQQDALVAAKNALDVLVTELRGDKDDKKADPATTASGPAGPRHDDNRDIRPAAETRPAHAGGQAKTNTSQAPGRAAGADGPSSTAPAAAAHGTSHGTGTDWISGHPFSADIGTLRQAALADSTLTEQARVNGLDRFLLVFRPWADDHVARTGTSPDSPLPPFAAAYFDDPVFAADLTGTLAARIRQSLTGPPGPGDPSPDADATAEAARAVKASIESKLRDACPCGSGCGRCRLPSDRDPDLAEAVRISIRLSRAGMPHQQRVIAWDQASASYGIEYPVPDGGTYRLPVPPEGKQIRISHSDGSATVTSRTRGDPDATEWAAAAYAEATRHQTDASLAHRTGTPARPAGPGLEGAARADGPEDTVTQQAAVSASGPPAGQAAATAERAAANPPAPTAAHGRPANQDQDEDQAAAPEPADDPAGGLVIEHHQQGTLVHGTEKNDQQLRRLLREQRFRWSGNLNAWYLPRPWTFSTRSHRVTGLTASLRQAHRSFTMRSQPPAPSTADDSPPEPAPAGEPYTDLRQAQDDHSTAVHDYWELTRTPAGNNVMSTRQPGARPDAAALDAAYHAVHVSWHQAFAGDPHEVADRFTAWMQAASTLSRHLAAEQHRAPKLRQTLDDFIRSATRLASRTQATAEDTAAWARVFAGIPGDAPDTNPPPQAITPGRAQPAASSPEPGAAPAGNEQARQDSDEPGHTAAPAATSAPSPAPPADTAPALPAACRSAADLRQLAAAYGLSTGTEHAGTPGTQQTVVHDDGRTVLLHDDISGTKAGGYQLNPGEVPAYLAAYARHPQLPPRCLADLIRHDPAAPGMLTLAVAREIAARHELEVRIRRARGQAYITFCEPGVAGPPVLSYPAGTGSACHGPCTVPVAAINGYLFTYRDSVPAAMFTAAAAAPKDWARRVAQLAPHLVDEGGYFVRGVRDHLRAALAAVRDGNTEEASRLLSQAETMMPPLTPTPEREAELLAIIGEHAARYGYTDDPAGYMARAMPPLLDASDREWEWVRTYISAHPDVREHTAQDGPAADAGQPDDGRQAAAGKSGQAKTALENEDYEQALALLDEAELLYPDHGVSWDAARDQVRGAMKNAISPQPQDQDSPGPPAPDAAAPAAPGSDPARPGTTASTGPTGHEPGTAGAPGEAHAGRQQQPGAETSAQDDPAQQAGTVTPGQGIPDGAVEPVPATPAGHYEARIAGHPWDHQAWPATPEGRASAEQHARSHSARSDHVWEVRHVPAASAGEPAIVCRYRHGRLQLAPTTLQPATTGKEAGTMASPAAPAAQDLRDRTGPPEGTQPLPAHTGWAGNLRPERLLYADGTPLTIRGQGEDGDQVLPATAAGAVPVPTGSDYISGRLQVVRWDDGGYAIVHPALASPRDIDAYTTLSDRDRARWEAFDLAEAWPTTTAGMPPHLVDAGDILQVERGPRSHTTDLRQVESIRPGSGAYTGGLEFKAAGVRSPLYYPARSTVPVCIPQEHPSLPAALQAATMTGPGHQETAAPAPDAIPAARPAPGDTAKPSAAPDQDPPGAAGSAHPDGQGQYTSRIRISDAAPGSPQKPRRGMPDDAPAAGNSKADEVVASARRRAEARSRAHVPIDYARANAMIRRQRAALTRAINSGDPAKVILAAQKAVREWNQPGMAWPDNWSRWQRALDHVLPWNQHILLKDLAATAAPDDGTPMPGSTAGQHLGASADAVTGTARREPAAPGGPEPPPGPVTNSDLATALHRLRGWDFARLVSGAGAPDPAGSRISRQDSEPDAGAHEELDWDNSGIDITISAPGIRRHGHLPWPQVATWIGAGMTPARLGLIITSDRLHSFCLSARDKLTAAGKCDPDAASAELAQIRDDTISTVITAALSTRGAVAPVPPARPGQPAYHTAAMISRPDPAAGKTENTALERLAQLRAAIQEPQPITAAEVRTTIKRWIGDGLPDYVRALGESAAMRAWISRQVATRASRPAQVTYETPGIPGGRWYGASPEGLLTARGNDDRAETLIPWDEIPAWVQPGITTSLRDRLLTADDSHRAVIRRRLTAAAHPQASPARPGDQEDDDQAGRLRREAISAAWAAVEAAHPPAPAQLEHARRTYRDTGPAQETLFASMEPARQQDNAEDTAGGPAAPGQPLAPAEPRPAAQPGDTPAAPATATDGSTPAEPGRQHDAPSPVPAPVAAGGAARGQQHAPAARPQPGSAGTPLTADDIVLGLSRLPALVFADLIAITDSGQPMGPVSRQMAPYSAERAASEPDAGAQETVTPSPAGLRIQVTAVSGTRAGLLSWPEVADWLRPGLTPGRRQIVLQATRTRLSFAAANASFRAVGEASLAAGAERELRTLAATAISAVLDAARAARAGQPRPGGRPSQPADDEAAALERITDLAAALPARLPQPRTPVSHVKAGDIVGHPGYKLQPFRISAPPRHHDDRIEITGRLTEPSEGEPAGQITFTLPRTRQQDPVVLVVHVPARSLRAPLPETTAGRGITQDRTHDSDTGPGEDAQPAPGAGHEQPAGTPPRQHAPAAGTTANGTPAQGTAPSAATPAPDGVTRTSQPAGTATPSQEDTMPPEPAATSPEPAAPPAPAAAPATAPGPAPAANQAASPRGSGSETRRADPPAGQGSDEAQLLHELDDVLTAIIEHRRAGAPQSRADDDFADIRAAFTSLRKALDPAAPTSQDTGHSSRPAAAVPDPAEPAGAAPAAAHDGHADGTGDFDDIRAAFADLRHVLELPAHGRHAHGTSPHPAEPADPAASRLLDQSAAEAQACARWYRDTPEWQRITKIGRAARELIGAIREASGDYWAEIRQDIRARGFARTLTARVSLAVSGAAHILASRLERAGHPDTRAWRAAWGLHRATATFADRIIRYSPPGQRPGRMNDVRRIIDDLSSHPRSPSEPADPPASSTRRRPPATPAAVTLANTSFPAPVSQATIRPPSGSDRPAAASPVSHRRAAHRP